MKHHFNLLLFFLLLFSMVAVSHAATGDVKSVKPLSLSPEGALTPELRARIQATLPADSQTKANINAVTANNINSLVINRELVTKHTNLYSNKIDSGKITNQKASGRCWLFASLNMIRQPMLKRFNVDNFEFSENYLFFWDKMEKANLFLEAIIATSSRDIKDKTLQQFLREPFEDGGQWNYAVALIKKYGLMPKQAMEETIHSSSTGAMDRMMASLLRKDASILRKMAREGKSAMEQRKRKEAMLTEVYRVLAYCLGTPPERFEFRYEDKSKKTSVPRAYTPLEFYQREVSATLDDYICIYSCPTWPFGRLYQINLDRDMVEKPNMTFINMEMGELKALARSSVLGGEPVWFGCDSGKDNDRVSGIMARGIFDYRSLFGVDTFMDKTERVLYNDSTPTHAMVFTGIDIVDGKVRKWLVENSWGKERGHDGYFCIYDNWFDEYVYSCIIHKKYLSAATLEILKTEPTVLPEDDPMRDHIFPR